MEGRSFANSRSLSLRWRHDSGTVGSGTFTTEFYVQLAVVFLAYFVAGKLGQATSHVRSDYVGPVWPAYGVAVASTLAFGYRVWPALLASAFVVSFRGSVGPLTAFGQAAGATLAAATAGFAL